MKTTQKNWNSFLLKYSRAFSCLVLVPFSRHFGHQADIAGCICVFVLLFFTVFLPSFSTGAAHQHQYCQRLLWERYQHTFTLLSIHAQDEEKDMDTDPDPVFFPVKNPGKILQLSCPAAYIRHNFDYAKNPINLQFLTNQKSQFFHSANHKTYLKYVFGTLQPSRAGPIRRC